MASLRVLVAPQELKGTLTAVEATQAIIDALRATYPSWQFDALPMADGGPGTTDALLAALGGEPRTSAAHDPLMRQIEAPWGVLPGPVATATLRPPSPLAAMTRESRAM